MEKILPTVSTAALALAGAVALPMQAQALATTPITPMAAIAPAAPRAAGVSAPPAAAGPSTYNITIHAAPGMDAQAIARAVAAEMDRRERQAAGRRNASLHDLS